MRLASRQTHHAMHGRALEMIRGAVNSTGAGDLRRNALFIVARVEASPVGEASMARWRRLEAATLRVVPVGNRLVPIQCCSQRSNWLERLVDFAASVLRNAGGAK